MKRLIALTVRLFTAHVTKGPKGMSGRRARFSRGRVTRFLRNKAPKLVENTKKLLAMRGLACSQEMTSLLRDLTALKKPNAVFLPRLNPVLPFEDASSLEFMSDKNDASLMLVGSHSKKRPQNLVMARFFDHKVLDLIELGVTGYTAMEDIKCEKRKAPGSKPCFLFQGDWEADPRLATLKNLFLDMFRGTVVEQIALPALDHVIVLSCVGTAIYMRVYSLHFKRSGTKIPLVELESCGPNVNFELRRSQLASADLAKAARKQPKQLKPAKVKNISYDGLGTKEGRVHMERQDFEKLQTRKIKALKVLKKRQKYEDAHGGAGDGSDAEGDDREDGEDGSEEPAPSRNKRARK